MPTRKVVLCTTGTAASLALVSAVVATVVCLALPPFIDSKLEKGINDGVYPTSVDTAAYKSWSKNDHKDDPKVKMTMRLFSIKNADDVMNKGSTPELEEYGPFTYWEHKIKQNITYLENGELLQYNDWQYYTLIPEESAPLDTKITTLNLPLIGFLGTIRQSFKFEIPDTVYKLLIKFLEREENKIFMTHTAEELLHGFEADSLKNLDKIFEEVEKFTKKEIEKPDPLFTLLTNMTSPEQAFKKGPSVVRTGKTDKERVMYYTKHSNVTYQEFAHGWEERITGTDGTSFKRGVKREDKLKMFLDDAMRVVNFVYENDVELNGVKLYRFKLDENQLKSTRENVLRYRMNHEGMVDLGLLSTPKDIMPAYLCKPHFLDVDPAVAATVKGLSPEESKHESVVDVEPITGKALSAAKRLQMTIRVDQTFPKALKKNFPHSYIPIFWGEEAAAATPDQCKQFTSQVYTAQNIRDKSKTYGMWAAVVCGGLFLVSTVAFMTAFFVMKKPDQEGYVALQEAEA